MEQISLIHKAIRSLSIETELSDPCNFTWLPFPAPLRLPEERFARSDKGFVRGFRYMGRSFFQDLLKEISDPNFLNGSIPLYLYGPYGTGKSHLIAALVCYLIWMENRVVFIPHCGDLLENPEAAIRTALLFAFHNDPYMYDKINHAGDMDGLVRLVEKQPNHTLYVVVDQRNALDLDGQEDRKRHSKMFAMDSIDKLRYSQRSIFTVSANQQSDREMERKGARIKTVNFRAGLNEVCHRLFGYFISCFPRTRLGLGSPNMPTHYPDFPTRTVCLSNKSLGTFRF
jgi:hypothetical protein